MWKIVVGGITGLAAILGIAGFGFFLVPKVSVSQSAPLNASDPFSAPFEVSNDGPLGLNEVKVSCALLLVKREERTLAQNLEVGRDQAGYRILRPLHRDATGRVIEPDSNVLVAVNIPPGQKTTVPCLDNTIHWGVPITHADVAIVVSFRSDYLVIRQTKTYRFVTAPRSDGNLYWFPRLMEQ